MYTRRAMVRHYLRCFSLFALLTAAIPGQVRAEGPAKVSAASAADEAVDKEIERLHAEAKYDDALALAEKTVADREARLGKEHPRTASAVSDLGAMHLAKGNIANAEPLLKRAIEILEKEKDAESILAVAISNLASVYSHKGDLKRAQATMEKAVAIGEKAGSARESEYALLVAKLGTIYMKSGRFAEAEKLLLKAISIHEKRKDEQLLFADLGNIGTLYRGMGLYDKAADAYNRAVPIAARIYGGKHPEVGNLYHVIGVFLTGSSQYDKAEDYFGRSEKVLLEALGPKHPDVAAMYSDWAVLLTRTAQIDRALEMREKAQDIDENWLSTALASGTDDDKLAYASHLERSIDRIVSFQMGLGLGHKGVRRFVLQTVLRNKARALEATAASTRALRERMTPENKKRFDELARVRGELASRYTRGPRGQSVSEFQKEVDELSRQAEAIDAEISKESIAYRQAAKAVTVDAVAKHLPKDAALVEFVQYRHYNSHFYSAASERETTPRFMVYVLRPDGQVFYIQLPVTGYVIDDKVAKIRRGLQDPSNTKVFRELSLLHDIIFIRLLPLLPGIKHLLISPDGDLSLVPFGALLAQDGHFLAEKYTVTYLSSGRDILRFGEHDLKGSAPTLIANPDYNAPGEADSTPLPNAPRGSLPLLARAKFSPLPGTAQEADAIRNIIPDPRVKLQQIATETELKQVSGPKILHVATHGFFLDETGKAAKGTRGLELEIPSQALPTVKASLPSAKEKIEILNPMFLSGLALAGANVRKGQMDDGILTAYEASALDLTGTELVVLSACETGVGSRVAREGVRGLRRALVLAGSETQVMSLWQVDDDATRDLMKNFYQNLYQKKLGRSEALRQSQLALLAEPARKHPFYWASFIVSGNWAPISGLPEGGMTTPTPKLASTVAPGGAKGCGCRISDPENDRGMFGVFLGALGIVLIRRRQSN